MYPVNRLAGRGWNRDVAPGSVGLHTSPSGRDASAIVDGASRICTAAGV